MTEEKEEKEEKSSNLYKLKNGGSNYLEWKAQLDNHRVVNDWYSDNSCKEYPDHESNDQKPEPTKTATNLKKTTAFKKYLLNTINPEIYSLDLKLSLQAIMHKLDIRFAGNLTANASSHKLALPSKMYFDPMHNPFSVIQWLERQSHLLAVAGEPVTNREFFGFIEAGLQPAPGVTAQQNFWFQLLGDIRKYDRDNYEKSLLAQDVFDYWKNYQTNSIVDSALPNSAAAAPVKPWEIAKRSTKPAAFANAVFNSTRKKLCKPCNENGREKVATSHDHSNCRYKNFNGTGFPESENQGSWKNNGTRGGNRGHQKLQAMIATTVAEALAAALNKDNEEYYLDTGATPTSYVKSKPLDFIKKNGSVKSAGAQSHATLGNGTVKIGKMKLNAIYVPSFTKNLISGVDINRQGLHQTIANDRVVVSTGPIHDEQSSIVATGASDPQSGLFKLDSNVKPDAKRIILQNRFALLGEETLPPQRIQPKRSVRKVQYEPTIEPQIQPVEIPQAMEIPQAKGNWNSMEWLEIHRALGHASHEAMRNMLGPSCPRKPKVICQECACGKGKRKNIPKTSSRPSNPLDLVSIDIQGPFRVKTPDGCNLNFKIVDKATRYIKIDWISSKDGRTLSDCWNRNQARLERKTNRLIKAVQTDDDPCFMPLLKIWEEKGIVREKGDPYEHHFPPDAENANRLILHRSRAIHLDSNLPVQFYSDAQNCAVYSHNRTLHGKQVATPFELIHGYPPNYELLQQAHFGCLGYMLVPQEVRDKKGELGKLAPSSIPVRCLGYGDDGESEEIKGWKVLIPSTMSITYSKNVVWDKKAKMTPLLGHRRPTDQESADLYESYCSKDDDFDPEANAVLKYVRNFGIPAPDFTANPSDNENRQYLDPEEMMYAFLAMTEGVPVTYHQAMASPQKDKWEIAMKLELQKMTKRGVFELVDLPNDNKYRNVMKNRWTFRIKLDSKGTPKEYKARLVAKGFTQKHGIDFLETFAPVAKLKSIRALTQICVSLGLQMLQDDVPTAFLQALFATGIEGSEEEGWMDQPIGFEDGSGRKWKLKKCIYGMKQSPREFNQLLHQFLIDEGFKQSEADSCIYIKGISHDIIIVAIYVDDIITAGKCPQMHKFRQRMQEKFEIESGSELEWYLGIRFDLKKNGARTIDQDLYVANKLAEFSDHIGPSQHQKSAPLPSNVQSILEEAENSNETEPNFPYRPMVGSLMYAMTGTRFDIAFAVSIVSQFLQNPKKAHCDLVRHIYQYLRAYPSKKIEYLPQPLVLEGSVDASYANNTQCLSTSGYVFTLGSGAISWNSKKQSTTALSAAEAEYIAAVHAGKECLWWKSFLKPLDLQQANVILHEDNQAAIALSKNPQFHDRSKHIQIKYHWIREQVARKEFMLSYVRTKDQLADMFTKPLQGFAIRPLCTRLGLRSSSQGEN